MATSLALKCSGSKTLLDDLERAFQKLELEVDESLSKIRDTDVLVVSNDPAAIDRVNSAILSHPVLEGKPNANHVRARISNSCTQQLHNMDIITQCSNGIKKVNNSRLHHDVQDIHIVFTIIKVRKRNVDKRGLHRQPTGGLPLTHA
jgi:hypothetical protein